MKKALVAVLHRLALDERRRTKLSAVGLDVIMSRSVAQTLAIVEDAEAGSVLVDLGVGGHAPEKIARALAERPGFELVACTTSRYAGLTSRARKLGVDAVYVFPEGAIARIFSKLPQTATMQIRRAAPRALVREEIVGEHLRGTLVNISASGAMFEVGHDEANLDEVVVEITLPGLSAPCTLRGKVRWREPGRTRTRLGIAFIGVSDETGAALDRFVETLNVVRVASDPVEGRSGPGQRAQATRAAGPRRKLRVNRVGDRRVDYFELDGDLADPQGSVLRPCGSFVVWWQAGEQLLARGADGQAVTLRVVERLLLDEDRVDGAVGWRVVVETMTTTATTTATATATTTTTTKTATTAVTKPASSAPEGT